MASFNYGDNKLGVVCDICLHRLYTERTGQEFPYHITEDARSKGWTHRKENGEWMDYCPKCADAIEEKRRGKYFEEGNDD